MRTPHPPLPLAADELTTLRSFLAYFRATIRRQTEDLTADQLTQTLPPSPLTLGGMLKHLAYVEQWWCEIVLHGRQPTGIWVDVDWKADADWDWHSAVDDSPAELLEMYDAAIAASDRSIDEALAEGGLDRPARRSRHGDRASLRWILVHLIEEYARHAGHADLIRESIDGETGL